MAGEVDSGTQTGLIIGASCVVAILTVAVTGCTLPSLPRKSAARICERERELAEHLPRLHLPRLHLPRLHLPRLHLPRLHLPPLHLPPLAPLKQLFPVCAPMHLRFVFTSRVDSPSRRPSGEPRADLSGVGAWARTSATRMPSAHDAAAIARQRPQTMDRHRFPLMATTCRHRFSRHRLSRAVGELPTSIWRRTSRRRAPWGLF